MRRDSVTVRARKFMRVLFRRPVYSTGRLLVAVLYVYCLFLLGWQSLTDLNDGLGAIAATVIGVFAAAMTTWMYFRCSRRPSSFRAQWVPTLVMVFGTLLLTLRP
jgi:hypothetical protein